MNRGVEIAGEVADRPNAVITEQVANGVSVRMAVLFLLLVLASSRSTSPLSAVDWRGVMGSIAITNGTLVDGGALAALTS